MQTPGPCEGLPVEFDLAVEIMQAWTAIRQDKSNVLNANRMTDLRKVAIMGLDRRAAIIFGGITNLCTRRNSLCAEQLTRSLFETLLSVAFVCRRRFVRKVFDGSNKPTRCRPVSSRPLIADFRAQLYFAFDVLQQDEFCLKCQKKKGMVRMARRLRNAVDPTMVSDWEQQVGPEWTRELRKGSTCAALNIGNLAKSLGRHYGRYYDILYAFQSRRVHPRDLMHHVDLDADETIRQAGLPDLAQAALCLRTACGVYLAILGEMTNCLQISWIWRREYQAFLSRHHALDHR